ncbi:MAG: hypothetical protein NTV34_13700, partial [Proteobacteria bacterium]|nr:hypothetical protein [Pseudomonadota bacterium]
MQKYLDWATFIKLDNAMTIDFLSSLAGTLADQGHFPSRELTQMKQALANRSVGWSKDEKSIVCSLMEEKSDALAALKIRYGTEGLSLNHTRFALKPLISDLINGLTLWADLILKKSELVFNRPFFVHNDHGIERRELFSQVLFATSQSLFDAVTDLRRAINEISTMRPSIILDVSGDFETIDSIVALQMGFSTIDDMGSFSRAESRALGRLGFALTELSTGITKINDYLIFNCLPSEDIMNTAVYCELLAAEVKRFSGLVFPDAGSTVAWEMRRQSICFS